jgi:hypothetical protein
MLVDSPLNLAIPHLPSLHIIELRLVHMPRRCRHFGFALLARDFVLKSLLPLWQQEMVDLQLL